MIQAMSFFTFYLANAPLGVSGVIAVVVFGLFGSATSKFELANSGGWVVLTCKRIRAACTRPPH